MCYGCWQEAGFPKVINEQVLACVELVRAADNECGIGAHIVIDDWNLDDGSIRWNLGADQKADCNQQEVVALEALLKLTEAERCSVMAIVDGFWSPVNPEI